MANKVDPNIEKPKSDKLMTLKDAVKRFVKPRRAWCLGGFGYTRTNASTAREAIRQKVPDLYMQTNAGATPMMMLAGANQLAWVEMTYLDSFGEAGLRGKNPDGTWIHPDIPPKRHAIIKDPFDAWGLRPHQYDPKNKFSPGDEPDTSMNKTCAEEDGIFYEKLRKRVNKYTGEKGPIAILYPPAIPFLTTTHAQRVGVKGTARMEGLLVPDVEQSISAKYLVMSAENVVPEEELRYRPQENQIPCLMTDAIIDAPWSCYPTGCTYIYSGRCG
jgi:glutaconate CoA-transferase subunit A